MGMKTEGIVITVKKIDKKYICIDQNGVEHTDVPDWRWRRAFKGEFKLIKKFDKNGRAHFKKYYEDYDGPVDTNSIVLDTRTTSSNISNHSVQSVQL